MKLNLYIEAHDKNQPEARFYDCYLQHLGFKESDYKINCIDGYTSIASYDNDMQQNTIKKEKNIIILDADDPTKNHGGVFEKQEYLKSKLNADYDVFVQPNNQDFGDFESLLVQIANPKHKEIMTCFDKFVACVESQEYSDTEKYNILGDKEKVYTYINAMPRSNSQQKKRPISKGDYLFDISEYWDLDSLQLDSLKSFLQNYK